MMWLLFACLSKSYDTIETPEGYRCTSGSGVMLPPDDLSLSISKPDDAETVFGGCLWNVDIVGCDSLSDFYAIAYPLDGWPYGEFTAVVSYHGRESLETTCSVVGSTDDGAGAVSTGEVSSFSVTVEE